MRIFDSKDSVRYGKHEELDDDEMQRIGASIEAIRGINRQIWQIVEDNSFPH